MLRNTAIAIAIALAASAALAAAGVEITLAGAITIALVIAALFAGLSALWFALMWMWRSIQGDPVTASLMLLSLRDAVLVLLAMFALLWLLRRLTKRQ
ncbi:MAG: hypothetical protein AB7F96_20535 [Beijerinckiaceae bacterium]